MQTVTPQRKKKIRRIAKDILKEAGLTKPPFLIQDILDYLEITWNANFFLVPINFTDKTCGACVVENNEVSILYNHTHPETRTRFTQAHEIGHFVLGHKLDVINRPDLVNLEDNRPYEIEANTFAAELLMPRFALTKMNYEEEMVQISTEFMVSYSALRWRIINDLGIIDNNLGMWQENMLNKSESAGSPDSSFSGHFPPHEDYEDSYLDALENFSEYHVADIVGIKEYIYELGDEDDFPETIKALNELAGLE